jgi:hypothetical protein
MLSQQLKARLLVKESETGYKSPTGQHRKSIRIDWFCVGYLKQGTLSRSLKVTLTLSSGIVSEGVQETRERHVSGV